MVISKTCVAASISVFLFIAVTQNIYIYTILNVNKCLYLLKFMSDCIFMSLTFFKLYQCNLKAVICSHFIRLYICICISEFIKKKQSYFSTVLFLYFFQ